MARAPFSAKVAAGMEFVLSAVATSARPACAPPDAERLQAAEGYLELGLPFLAARELDQLKEGDQRHEQVKGLRMAVFRALQKLDLRTIGQQIQGVETSQITRHFITQVIAEQDPAYVPPFPMLKDGVLWWVHPKALSVAS